MARFGGRRDDNVLSCSKASSSCMGCMLIVAAGHAVDGSPLADKVYPKIRIRY